MLNTDAVFTFETVFVVVVELRVLCFHCPWSQEKVSLALFIEVDTVIIHSMEGSLVPMW